MRCSILFCTPSFLQTTALETFGLAYAIGLRLPLQRRREEASAECRCNRSLLYPICTQHAAEMRIALMKESSAPLTCEVNLDHP